MKVTTEKLPKSLIAFDIELEPVQVEKGLDRAARKISQRANIPGFRKGKAPRFIVENYFGREALLEEASDDLIQQAFRDALKQSEINPVGQASLQSVEQDPFRFRVTVPVPPTVTLPDYRAILVPLESDSVTDEDVERALDRLRDKHTVLKELEEPRPAQQGDQLTIKMESFADGEPLEPRDEGKDVPESTLVLEPDRLVTGLYEGLLGVNAGETREIATHLPDDHPNEQVRDKDVTFKVEVIDIQERELAEWDDLPTLEEFDGTLDALRVKTRADLEAAAKSQGERKLLDSYIEQLIAQSEFDIPDVLIHEQADELLHDQLSGLERYGITIEQYLQYRGQSHDDAVEELLPQGEQRLKTSLALQELARGEQLSVAREEVDAEMGQILEQYSEEQLDQVKQMLNTQMLPTIVNSVLDKKLRARLVEIAQGIAPALTEPADEAEAATADAPDTDEPAAEAPAAEAEAATADAPDTDEPAAEAPAAEAEAATADAPDTDEPAAEAAVETSTPEATA